MGTRYDRYYMDFYFKIQRTSLNNNGNGGDLCKNAKIDVIACGNPPYHIENVNIDVMGCGNAPFHVENVKSMWEGRFLHSTASKMRN